MRCQHCHRRIARVFFQLINVCPECFNELMQRKLFIKKEHERMRGIQ